MRPPWWLFLPNLLLLIDWARNQRSLGWFCVLACLGPAGALLYTVYFWESITFPFPLASTFRSLMQKPVTKRCHRCQQLVSRVEWVEDGRTRHLMCASCAVEMRLSRSL